MEDTAQPLAAETPLHEQIDSAAAALRAMRVVNQPRDDAGRFAGEAEPEAEQPDQGEPVEGEANDEPDEYEGEGPDEDQPAAVEMPKSWGKEDEAVWSTLPPEAQAKIAEREGQRDAAINSKFQEAAIIRKDFESKLNEANASRDKWAQQYDLLIADLDLPEPDPRQFGLGTQNYRRDAYDMAVLEWKQGRQRLDTLKQQREDIRAQQQREIEESWNATKAQINAQYEPVLLSLKPELTDPAKAETSMRELVQYALENGLAPETFAEENQPYITAAQLALLEKARLYDKLSKGGVKPAPKQQPSIKPGVATPRSAARSVERKKAFERLATDNSIESAAAAMRALRRK